MWAIAGIFALNYNCKPQDVLDMTLANIMMYNAVIPTYKGSGKNGQERINADDPKNANRIREILKFKK